MKILRTPEHCFHHLKDYPFEPRYADVAPGLRMHYLDEGPKDAAPVLMLHGEPSWSYLYRHMIPLCVAAGHRVIAPDLIGFGRSDKPAAIDDYSYQSHMDWITIFVSKLDLQQITLFCQDWGSLLGLRLAAEQEPRFARIVLANGGLPTGDPPGQKKTRLAAPLPFLIWRTFARLSPVFPVGHIVNIGAMRALDDEERRAYDAPFTDSSFKAGARAFPRLVPITPDDPASSANRAAWKVLERWEKPFLTAFSTGDPITRGIDKVMQARIPGARGVPHRRVRGGHFVQENSPKELAAAINELIVATPLG